MKTTGEITRRNKETKEKQLNLCYIIETTIRSKKNPITHDQHFPLQVVFARLKLPIESWEFAYPANIYLFKVTMKTLEKDVKYAQSLQ